MDIINHKIHFDLDIMVWLLYINNIKLEKLELGWFLTVVTDKSHEKHSEFCKVELLFQIPLMWKSINNIRRT